jgi:hypothetical protein
MINCNRCGKDNQDNFKFCLGCGHELTPRADVGMMKTMMVDQPPPERSPSPSAPPVSRPSSMPGGMLAGMPPSGPLSTNPPALAAPVGPPPGVPGFSPGFAAPSPAAGARRCPSCGSDVLPGFRFCGSCGFRMDEPSGLMPMPSAPAPVVPTAKPTMTLIRPDGTEGGVFELTVGDNKLGRRFGAIFENDGYLSPVHAEINIRGQSALVRDLDSLNGVFVKMNHEEELTNTQIIRIGQELLRFEFLSPPAPTPDGTELMGSPNPGYWGKLTVIIGREVTGAVFPLLGDSVTIGRERGEINFPDDGYVSGLHARISFREGRVFIADLGSSNGSFVKVNGERQVGMESFVLLGQQLFRVNLT